MYTGWHMMWFSTPLVHNLETKKKKKKKKFLNKELKSLLTQFTRLGAHVITMILHWPLKQHIGLEQLLLIIFIAGGG